jgi:mycothiol synthase
VPEVEILPSVGAAEIAEINHLLAAAEERDGERPLSDLHWVDLQHGGGPGFTAVVARDGAGPPIAYAQVSPSNESWSLELVLAPDGGAELGELGRPLLSAAFAAVAAAGGGAVHWWARHATDDHVRLANEMGLEPGRVLHQMRRSLPTGIAFNLPTRPFVVGQDEAAWVVVNNRAFAGHPEQGGWTVETLRGREQEPWFDPSGFLLHERDGRLAGFCWTKIHTDRDPVLGEIYVVGADPDFHGHGLGTKLTLAGLDHMAGGGVGVGMLYVDADNAAAMQMYERIGFTIHHSDRAFVGEVSASSAN